MGDSGRINRRDLIVTTAGAASAAGVLTGGTLTPALAQSSPPPGFDAQEQFARNWDKRLGEVVYVDLNAAAPELANEAAKERHRIFCFLLMKLIHRFWNGNKRGPLGAYPLRAKQMEPLQLSQPASPTQRYRGDTIEDPDRLRVNWDRYVGHNIACIAVDGHGEIIDFDFNHNDFFRSSTEHAESRMVRRLFSLTDIFDSWKTGEPIRDKSRAFSLREVTLYTSLESCAQCAGVMSLGGVKQVIYLQNDFTTYMIGNIMFNLANHVSGVPGAPIPIPASEIGLEHFKRLNDANLTFVTKIQEAERRNDSTQAFFVSPDKSFVDYDPSITSFLCTDVARDIFAEGAKSLNMMTLRFPTEKYPGKPDSLTNEKCLEEARRFYKYADIEGYRGSPHKL
jgi:tRNA(Arg) A34 adenosine deaminase TadA